MPHCAPLQGCRTDICLEGVDLGVEVKISVGPLGGSMCSEFDGCGVCTCYEL